MLSVIQLNESKMRIITLGSVLCLLMAALPAVSKAQEKTTLRNASAHGLRLSETRQRIVFDSSFMTGPSTASPHWESGFLVSREIETFLPGEPNVRLYDKSGTRVRSAAIWFDGAHRVMIRAAAPTPDGRIVASGIADKADGTAAPFIALTDLSGKVTDVVRTDGFYPTNICVAPDNTVWSFGGTGYDEIKGANPGDVLRHFDFKNDQVDAFIPRSTYARSPMPDARVFMRCSSDRAVVYAPQVHEYIEMEYTATSPRRYRADAPANLKVDGFAFLGPKRVFGHFANQLSTSDPSEGLYVLLFDEAAKAARWLPIEGAVGAPTQPGTVRRLWGADNQELVISRAGDPAGVVAIHWVSPVDRN